MASFLLDASITTMTETASVNGLEVSEMDREGSDTEEKRAYYEKYERKQT